MFDETSQMPIKVLTLDDCPLSESNQYPFSKTIRFSSDIQEKLKRLEAAGRDPTKTIRMIIEEALKGV